MSDTAKPEPAKPRAERTRYRMFKKVDASSLADFGVDASRELFELLPGDFLTVREAHKAAGDGTFVPVPLRSFQPTPVRSETVTKVHVG